MKGKAISPEQDARILDLDRQNKFLSQIAKATGLSREGVRRRLKLLKNPKSK